MEKIYSNLEDLIFINLHHHQDVSEAHKANLDCLFTASHSFLKPIALIFEKLRVKVSNASR
jgi:hypothetical protein